MSTTILATKLYIPPQRPKVILRSNLIERLNEGLHRKLTLISAPSNNELITFGFGNVLALTRCLAVLCDMKSFQRWLNDYHHIELSGHFIPGYRIVLGTLLGQLISELADNTSLNLSETTTLRRALFSGKDLLHIPNDSQKTVLLKKILKTGSNALKTRAWNAMYSKLVDLNNSILMPLNKIENSVVTSDKLKQFPVDDIITMTIGSGPFFLLFLPVKALPFVVRMAPSFLLIAVVATYFVIVSAGWKSWAVLCGIAAVFLAMQILFQRPRKSGKKEDKAREPVLIDSLFSTIRSAWIWTPVVIVALIVGLALMGWAYAKEKTTFIVLGAQQPIVVLQVYDDFAITAPISNGPDGKTMVREFFTIYKLDTLPDQPLRYLRVGPLLHTSRLINHKRELNVDTGHFIFLARISPSVTR